MAYLTRDEAQRLTQRVLSFSKADQARVNVWSAEAGHSRFAENQISTGGDVSTLSITVTSAFGSRVAAATTNRSDQESLRRTVQTSQELARLAPEDPEYLGELGPEDYVRPNAVFPATAGLTPERRAQAVRAVTDISASRTLVATGFATHRTGSQGVATSKGLFAYHAASRANFTTTVRTPDGTGSGWAGIGVDDWSDVEAAMLGATAADKADASRNPRAVDPGRWTVIFEPTAVASMVGLMIGSMAARNADEGRSFFSRPGGGNRIGETFLDTRVTIVSDPAAPGLSIPPFTEEGLPARRAPWVEDGTLVNLLYDRFWARKTGRMPTGVGWPMGYTMQGGNDTVEAMIRSTDRGLLVTRLWYIRGVDPRTILFTGLTRDGTFLIENGRISHPVQNLRWNESPVFMLNNVEMMGRPVQVSASESGDLGPAVRVPPLKVRDFTFTSVSDAV